MTVVPERNITAEEAVQILNLVDDIGHRKLVNFILMNWIIASRKYCSDERIKTGLSSELEMLLNHNFEVLGLNGRRDDEL